MNILFENEYTMKTEFFKEYVYHVLCKNMTIVGILISLLGIVFFFLADGATSYIVFTAAIISGIAAILTPVTMVKQLEETEKRLNNGKIEPTKVVFSKNIAMDEGKVHLEFEYNQISKIVQTKNFIVLKTSAQSAILVFKNGFSKGNEKDFLNFIEEKTNAK